MDKNAPPEKTNGGSKKQLPFDGRTWDRARIWCLGTDVDGYQYVSWHAGGVNFTDCDILIVDVRSLQDILLLEPKEMISLSNKIRERLEQGDFVLVCVISDKELISGENMNIQIMDLNNAGYDSPFAREHNERYVQALMEDGGLSNYFWLPYDINTYKLEHKDTKIDDRRKTANLRRFDGYLNESEAHEIGISASAAEDVARTKSGDAVACMIGSNSSTIVMLPPLQTPEESVGKVAEILSAEPTTEPEWSRRLDVPGDSEIKQKISALRSEIAGKTKQAEALERCLKDRGSFKKLLYQNGPELEGAVMEALTMLGLSVERGDLCKEDLVLSPSIGADYAACSIEIKGTKNKINTDNLGQLRNQVDCQRRNGTTVKGIFVANMHRLSDIESSRDERGRLEPDQLECVHNEGFCIVPTHVLFELCKKLVGGQAVDRRKIEQVLVSTVGVVTLEDLQA